MRKLYSLFIRLGIGFCSRAAGLSRWVKSSAGAGFRAGDQIVTE